MLHNLLGVLKSLIWLLHQQTIDEVACNIVVVANELHLFVLYLIEEFLSILTVEGWYAR